MRIVSKLRLPTLGILFAAWSCTELALEDSVTGDVLAVAVVTADLQPERLRCEYRTEPLGVDQPRPELSWIVTSKLRGQVQTAYRILVASSPTILERDQGDLWDTGKVSSNATFAIEYAGADLHSHQQCYWKVMVWDGTDRPSSWSVPAHWSMGVMDQGEWQGEWIGYDGERHVIANPPPAALHESSWICHPEDDQQQAEDTRSIYLGVWDLPKAIESTQATLTVCADDSSIVLLNGKEVARTSDTHQPVSEEVTSYVRPGRNSIRVLCKNHQGVSGLCLKLELTASDGQQYTLATDEKWYCVRDGHGSWQDRPIESALPARVLGPFGMQPWGQPHVRRDLSPPPSYLRGTFAIERPFRSAVVYLAALGSVDLTLNGQPVNRDYFSSGWTDYTRRVYYRAYDVTDSVLRGENVMGAVLADGWFSGHIAWGARRDFYGTKPRFRAMLRVEYEDGTSELIATDKNWTVTTGPKKLADILVGEEYDARQEISGWDEPGTDPDILGAVDVGAEVSPQIQWHPGPPVVEIREFPAKSFHEPVPGVYVFDIGQNIAGIARIQIRGYEGQRLKIRYAERLNPDGTIHTANLRLARATDFYTCRGSGVETWQPRQTFHGFQYVEVSGFDEQPSLDAVTGIALTSDTPLASDFECSDSNLNRLYQNVLWTQRANFIDVPTDCPQRDERLGWTGDAQVYVYTACRVADVQSFFRKWLRDLSDAQRSDGQFPRVAPVIPGEEDGGPAWSDAGVICPWEVYQSYGDRKLLERQYPSMVKFVEFCRNRSKDEVLPPKDFHTFGDWLSVNADTPREVIYMAYYARSVDLLQRAANVLGRSEDAKEYADLLRRIKRAFIDNYVGEDGRIRGNTQCAYVLAIAYDLVKEEQREKAAAYLVEDIESRGWKLSTGFIGTKDLMLALSEIGRCDVALRLLHQTDYPGWMFSISQGATSIWERWDGWTPEHGFQDPAMNSFAHYSFGAVYGWMVESLGGIRSVEPGFGKLVIQPTFDPKLDHCRIRYDSIRGPIETQWRIVGDQREYRVKIPANVTAVLRLPGVRSEELQVDNKPLQVSGIAAEVRLAESESPISEVGLSSGEYLLTFPR